MPPLAAPMKTVVLPPEVAAAIADTRPLIAADPMLRMPRPETAAVSNTGGRTFAFGGAAEDAAWGRGGPGTTARAIGVPAGGKRKSAASAATFASARSMVRRIDRGAPFRPASIEKGTQTPSTRW